MSRTSPQAAVYERRTMRRVPRLFTFGPAANRQGSSLCVDRATVLLPSRSRYASIKSAQRFPPARCTIRRSTARPARPSSSCVCLLALRGAMDGNLPIPIPDIRRKHRGQRDFAGGLRSCQAAIVARLGMHVTFEEFLKAVRRSRDTTLSWMRSTTFHNPLRLRLAVR